jgi:ubiquinone/menaquinone biosynthesis C-methylase UbiE
LSWKAFDTYAKEYDAWYKENKEILESECKLIKSLDLKGFGIDIGVGTGIFASFSNVSIGIDPAINMLKIAKSKGIEVIRASGEFIPFREKVFDFAIMIATLCFLERPREVLKEIHRILKDNGIFVACILPRNSKWGELYEKKKLEGHRLYKFAHFYTVEEACSLINEMGFKVVMIRSTLRQPPGAFLHVEEPEDGFKDHGFSCIKAIKSK